MMSRLRRWISSVFEYLIIFILRHIEKKKFRSKKRKAIYSTVVLSKDQKKNIDNLFIKNYGKKIPYTWHRHFTAFTGNFDEKYFPEMLYIPEFEYFMNYKRQFAKVFEDKNALPLIAKSVGISTPKTLLSATEGVYRDQNYAFITKDSALEILRNVGKAFVKPSVDSSSGRGCGIIDVVDGVDSVSGKKLEELLDSFGKNFCLQRVIKNHENIAKLHENSVNTFRVITYRWKNEICFMPIIMRIGQGGNFVDNAHAGGMFIAVNDDGTLHKKAFTEFKKEFVVHPTSKVVFEGYKIDFIDKIKESAERMHQAIPQIGVVNWDFTVGENGEIILVEANVLNGSVWLVEIAHGKGAFGEKTAEILKWIRFMKKTPKNKRKNYLFGNVD